MLNRKQFNKEISKKFRISIARDLFKNILWFPYKSKEMSFKKVCQFIEEALNNRAKES